MSPQPGIVHNYSSTNPKLTAFEHSPPSASSSSHNGPTNYLLFIGGMGDGLHTVPIVSHLSPQLPDGWRLVEVLTSSSYIGWGTGSLKRDVEEMAQAVQYFRGRTEGDGKIVIMGHSTGSQDVLQYALTMADADAKVEKLDGAILQASVSDRESIVQSTDRTTYLTGLTFAESFISSGQGAEVMPLSMRPGFEDTPITAERWFSITAPLNPTTKEPQGSDDFFSSDITPTTLATTFGRIPVDLDLLVLYSGSDEHVPIHVDKDALIGRWKKACKARWSPKSGIIKGATHALENVSEEVVKDFVERVADFLFGIGKGDAGDEKDKEETGENTVKGADVGSDSKSKPVEEPTTHTDEKGSATTSTPTAKVTEPEINEVDESAVSPTTKAEDNDKPASATASDEPILKPTEVEEPTIKPTEVEETTTETTEPSKIKETIEGEQNGSATSTSATASANTDPVVQETRETEVKEVKEGNHNGEVEVPLNSPSEERSTEK